MNDHVPVTSVPAAVEEPQHGGRLKQAARAYPGATLPWLDLSTGINPYAYPLPEMPPEAWTRLPEPEDLAELEQAASFAYGAEGCAVVAAPGTSALIAVLARLFPGPAAILGPTYGEYAAAWPGALVSADLSDAFRARPVRIACQPDNPTGAVRHPAVLAGCAGAGVLIVDESYADFAPGASLVPAIRSTPGLVVLRSFGKAYGLAGVRLGFALAHPSIAETIRRALGPWPVSGPAILVGTAALADAAWRRDMRDRLRADRARLDALLRAAGFSALRGTKLFVLAHEAVPGWFGRLARQGILVRAWTDRPGALRFGLPGPTTAAWDRVTAALTPDRI